MDKSTRAAYFTQEEQTIILQKYEKHRHGFTDIKLQLLLPNPVRKAGKKIADTVNA